MLWSFLPWFVFFIFALVLKTKNIFLQKFRITDHQEAITWGGFVLTYLSLGMSKYQLPHYIFVAFPFAAIITADFIKRLSEEDRMQRLMKRLKYFHVVLFILLLVTMAVLVIWPFDNVHQSFKIMAVIAVAAVSYFLYKIRQHRSFILQAGLLVSIVINFFLNTCFYPSLLKYQAGSHAGQWMRAHQIDPKHTFTFQYVMWRSLHFYAQGIVTSKDDVNTIQKGDYILTQKEKLPLLQEAHIQYDILYEGPDYPVSKISLPFLNPETRDRVLNHFFLIKII